MDTGLEPIPLLNLAAAFIPAGIVLVLMLRWSAGAGGGLIALGRMLLQLVLIGYLLNWIFAAQAPGIVAALLAVMLCAASWIAMRSLESRDRRDFLRSLFGLAAGGCLTLALVVLVVLEVRPWYEPRVVLPLGGMIFASSMNTVSLAAERFAAECARGTEPLAARRLAFRAALIPLLNSLLAVGLVTLPGMMTGQILSGIDPLIAARYQIMVMCMLTGAAGISAAVYLTLALRARSASAGEP